MTNKYPPVSTRKEGSGQEDKTYTTVALSLVQVVVSVLVFHKIQVLAIPVVQIDKESSFFLYGLSSLEEL